MTPADAIDMLDQQLSAHGQLVTIRRYEDPTDADLDPVDLVGIPAFVRAASADDVVGDIQTSASKIILSPTGLASLLPLLETDKIVVEGRESEILPPMRPIRISGQLVRIELLVAS